MPDLGNLALSATLAHCPNVKPAAEPSDHLSNSLYPVPIKTLGNGCIADRTLPLPVVQLEDVDNGNEIRVLKRSRGSLARVKKAPCKGLEDHVSDSSQKKMDLGSCRPMDSLPFLVGTPKMVECLVCHHFVCPGEELLCSVRGCEGVYHMKCAKEALGVSNLKKFKCPQHVCFICKQKLHWRCMRCTMAAHNKCAPWPDAVVHLKDHSGRAICWRHPTDWQLDRKAG